MKNAFSRSEGRKSEKWRDRTVGQGARKALVSYPGCATPVPQNVMR